MLSPNASTFYERTSRAIRRGDKDQMLNILQDLAKFGNPEEGVDKGIKSAIVGIISCALARADGDATYDYLTNNTRARFALRSIGRLIRLRALTADAKSENVEYEITISDLIPLDVPEIIFDKLIELSLVESDGAYVSITTAGINALETVMPGWQL